MASRSCAFAEFTSVDGARKAAQNELDEAVKATKAAQYSLEEAIQAHESTRAELEERNKAYELATTESSRHHDLVNQLEEQIAAHVQTAKAHQRSISPSSDLAYLASAATSAALATLQGIP